MLSGWREWGRRAFERRRQLSRWVLVLAVVVIGVELWSDMPRSTQMTYSLGPDHAHVVELQVVIKKDGEQIRGVQFSYPQGAPAQIEHEVELPSGRYEVDLELRDDRGRSMRLVRTVETPGDGVVSVRAHDEGLRVR